MRYKEVSIVYSGKPMKIQVHINGNEADEELEQMAIEVADNLDERVRKHLGLEE